MRVLEEITKDIEWRMSELGSLRTIPLRYNLLEHHREMIIKYTIPSIYALWEGFVTNSFKCYTAEINRLNLSIEEVHINLLTHGFSSLDKLRLDNPRLTFKSKKEFTEYYLHTINKAFAMSERIPTKANVSFSVINEILSIFNLEELPEKFKMPLKKLLHVRNSIAHGEIEIPVKLADINSFAQLLNELMIEITLRIEDGLRLYKYKK
jgi:hypothetical protein